MKTLHAIWLAGGLALTLGVSVLAAPRFQDDGKLIVPDIAAWPLAGASYSLTYEGEGASSALSTVRIDPDSFAAYVKTGAFPDGTMLALETRAANENVAPAIGGRTQGGVLSRSIHVKDGKGGPGTWTFYTYRDGATTANPVARTQSCYQCHAKEAKQDTAFTQFYPSLTEARAKAATPTP
ncbi:MAG: cytochrome [Caulobacteraceae bacterium]|nr:cytochrome [Caulobacteraceae bacterium]